MREQGTSEARNTSSE